MATFAIGDIQGCYAELMQLLDQIGFGHDDRIWLTGDLVNRGPGSLETLRFVKELGARAITVLGNHDLHLLALYHGSGRKPDPTLVPVFDAHDCDELMHWLQSRPLLHDDKSLGYVMTHAGIPHIWSLKQARQYAHELEQALQHADAADFFQQMYGNQPDRWRDSLTGMDRLRAITNYFTRMRFIKADGTLEFKANGGLETAPRGFAPWFEHTRTKPMKRHQLFGHWAALGFKRLPGITALDSGCVWGNALTAVRLEDGSWFSQPCPGNRKPGE
ncbi:symmetrical bis(5'-nucleosyl)-tetraphosphatase [Marinobacterium sediminicola]|uniref:bis(5'-nucleosyl)-tetraphosphatase (symmetrical) n=1 Tax=Marinobacterium sediminicola TaxID=518898 RepID=A0ABY1RYL8_9GAMM|nr:symmetrical bis(5'-nucleosyl)-tetraphosphatase [Marinobacterium sediminicola]ULG68710.1 symmetrical bis(5'-nucleosyl)-tetraphosphatase [Marinobacterium sediminicola]SMR73235.1 Bis(5'nucleosyl)-tetraphosphatase, ApaH [Marinobacterium sediminicola]